VHGKGGAVERDKSAVRQIIDAARTPGFSVARLRQAFDEQEDIH